MFDINVVENRSISDQIHLVSAKVMTSANAACITRYFPCDCDVDNIGLWTVVIIIQIANKGQFYKEFKVMSAAISIIIHMRRIVA